MNNYPPDFESFWQAFPKRIGDNPKWSAFKKWEGAIKHIPPNDLLKAAEMYANVCASVENKRLIPMASTWLYQRRWEQYLTPAEPVKKSGPNWDWICDFYKRTHKWMHQSPEPGYAGCPLPPDIAKAKGITL